MVVISVELDVDSRKDKGEEEDTVLEVEDGGGFESSVMDVVDVVVDVEEDIRVIEVMSVRAELLLDGIGRALEDEEVRAMVVVVVLLVLVPVVVIIRMEVEEDLFMKDETSRSAKGVYMRSAC